MEVHIMNSHSKKMVAPIVVTILMMLYYVIYFGLLILLLDDSIWKYALAIIPVAFSIILIMVCIERIKEIKKGEEDDISKY